MRPAAELTVCLCLDSSAFTGMLPLPKLGTATAERPYNRDFFNGWDQQILQNALDTCPPDDIGGAVSICFPGAVPNPACKKPVTDQALWVSGL